METEVAPQNQDLLMIVQNLNKNLTVSHIVSKVVVKSHLNKTLIQPTESKTSESNWPPHDLFWDIAYTVWQPSVNPP